jgi:hypothetical protein
MKHLTCHMTCFSGILLSLANRSVNFLLGLSGWCLKILLYLTYSDFASVENLESWKLEQQEKVVNSEWLIVIYRCNVQVVFNRCGKFVMNTIALMQQNCAH